MSRPDIAVEANKHARRPDVVLFGNGLPLGVLELKNAASEGATTLTAFRHLQTYKTEIPSLFSYNDALVVSDGMQARVAMLTAEWEWFKAGRTVSGQELADKTLPQLKGLCGDLFEPSRSACPTARRGV